MWMNGLHGCQILFIVVDFILFDNTIKKEVYFIQTSLSSYNRKGKKQRWMLSRIK